MLYIAEYYNSRILGIDLSSNIDENTVATFVLGQQDFDSNIIRPEFKTKNLGSIESLAIAPDNKLLVYTKEAVMAPGQLREFSLTNSDLEASRVIDLELTNLYAFSLDKTTLETNVSAPILINELDYGKHQKGHFFQTDNYVYVGFNCNYFSITSKCLRALDPNANYSVIGQESLIFYRPYDDYTETDAVIKLNNSDFVYSFVNYFVLGSQVYLRHLDKELNPNEIIPYYGPSTISNSGY